MSKLPAHFKLFTYMSATLLYHVYIIHFHFEKSLPTFFNYVSTALNIFLQYTYIYNIMMHLTRCYKLIITLTEHAANKVFVHIQIHTSSIY